MATCTGENGGKRGSQRHTEGSQHSHPERCLDGSWLVLLVTPTCTEPPTTSTSRICTSCWSLLECVLCAGTQKQPFSHSEPASGICCTIRCTYGAPAHYQGVQDTTVKGSLNNFEQLIHWKHTVHVLRPHPPTIMLLLMNCQLQLQLAQEPREYIRHSLRKHPKVLAGAELD